ncbi:MULTISPECIES: hypothetical protein [unclassified Streptomyces]|uniref:hypothetical protein n=1 Tax=unclassified Streptomyces TaxID=2593676 RepID=UPI001BED3401|nr:MULTISPECIES: hypothetical protein [unclassified Streptomyces]MBT2405607.1 hypothetical protein [Streptomyces sp. ISL-21]MBT2607713.1 hypothetical protein [Streptomyces sp. ISL-87]
MPRKPKMTDEERRAYSAKMRGELEAVMDRAYGAMVASEDFWAVVMRTAATLADRSPVNSIAVAVQCPHATRVLSSGDWRKAGRFPAKGSTSIRIWTPIKRRSESGQDATATAADGQQQAPGEATAEGEGWKVSGFKAGPVFDISQTDGDAYEPPAAAPLAVETIRDSLITQYRDAYHEDPEQSGGFDFTRDAPDNVARILLYGHAWRRITEADAPLPGQHAAEVASAAHVAALILGIAPGPVVMPPLAGIITQDKKPPVHESAVRVIETGRAIAHAVTTAAERSRELAPIG